MPEVLWEPNPGPQTAFLATATREVLFGGAVEGGKTDALLMAPLRWAHHPKHRALLLRRKEPRLLEVIDRTKILYPTLVPGAVWHETDNRWVLPAGGFISMGHMEHEDDVAKFKTFEFNWIGFDELTEFTEHQYMFMFMRNRAKAEDLPLQIRSGTNPGGTGMQWVFDRFIDKKEPYKVYSYKVEVEGEGSKTIERQYIPATIFDNPKAPQRDEYIAGLASLDDITREAYLYGRWGRFRGQFFPKNPKMIPNGIKNSDYYVIRCMDYGWDSPACVLWLVVYPKLRKVEIASEIYGDHMTTDSIAQMIRATEDRLKFEGKINFSVLSPDVFSGAAEGGQTIATLLMEKGIWFEKANNSRKSGWAQVLRLIDNDQLRVWEGQAPNLLRTLTKLPRHKNKPDDVQDRGVEDHAPEALRYGLMAYKDQVVIPIKSKAQPKPNMDPYWDQLQIQLAESRSGEYIEGLGFGW